MTPEKTKKAFLDCAALIKGKTGYAVAVRMPSEDVPSLARADIAVALRHLVFCCEEGVRLVEQGRTEKAMRWLGFIQGALWLGLGTSLDTLKHINMPEVPDGETEGLGS